MFVRSMSKARPLNWIECPVLPRLPRWLPPLPMMQSRTCDASGNATRIQDCNGFCSISTISSAREGLGRKGCSFRLHTNADLDGRRMDEGHISLGCLKNQVAE